MPKTKSHQKSKTVEVKNTPSYQAGFQEMQKRWPADQVAMVNHLYEFCPNLAKVVVVHGVAGIWAHDTTNLSVRERELMVFAALVALPQTTQAGTHAYNCLKAGVTEEQLKETLVLLTLYLGVPTILNVITPVKEAIAKFKQSKRKLKK